MGRPKLPLGTYGEVSCVEAPGSTQRKPRYVARARFRDSDGKTRLVGRYGQTKTKAKERLAEALRDRQLDVQAATVQADSTVGELADVWLTLGQDWSANTAETYRYVVANQVKAQLAEVTLREARPARIAAALTRIRDTSGPGAAKTARTVLMGMFDHAVAQDVLDANPAKNAPVTIGSGKGKQRAVRALTVEEETDLCDRLRSDKRADDLDLPDLVEWMLGTGSRIGEALAARHSTVDLDAGTWEINGTLIRVKGAGLTIQGRTKTDAGWRVLQLPSHLVAMVRRRDTELRLSSGIDAIFGSPHRLRSLRDPRNTQRELREALTRLGYEWATSHTFRKTVATRLDQGNLSARVIADQLGHAKPSLTQDVYMGRRVAHPEAAALLER